MSVLVPHLISELFSFAGSVIISIKSVSFLSRGTVLMTRRTLTFLRYYNSHTILKVDERLKARGSRQSPRPKLKGPLG